MWNGATREERLEILKVDYIALWPVFSAQKHVGSAIGHMFSPLFNVVQICKKRETYEILYQEGETLSKWVANTVHSTKREASIIFIQKYQSCSLKKPNFITVLVRNCECTHRKSKYQIWQGNIPQSPGTKWFKILLLIGSCEKKSSNLFCDLDTDFGSLLKSYQNCVWSK